ncbi:unnamed protein product, partial [Laminaria digitata]
MCSHAVARIRLTRQLGRCLEPGAMRSRSEHKNVRALVRPLSVVVVSTHGCPTNHNVCARKLANQLTTLWHLFGVILHVLSALGRPLVTCGVAMAGASIAPHLPPPPLPLPPP